VTCSTQRSAVTLWQGAVSRHDRRALLFGAMFGPNRITISRMGISKRATADLENAYREGKGPSWAADEAGVSKETAIRYFRQFAIDHLPRGVSAGRRLTGQLYRGPDWIGRPAK